MYRDWPPFFGGRPMWKATLIIIKGYVDKIDTGKQAIYLKYILSFSEPSLSLSLSRDTTLRWGNRASGSCWYMYYILDCKIKLKIYLPDLFEVLICICRRKTITKKSLSRPRTKSLTLHAYMGCLLSQWDFEKSLSTGHTIFSES